MTNPSKIAMFPNTKYLLFRCHHSRKRSTISISLIPIGLLSQHRPCLICASLLISALSSCTIDMYGSNMMAVCAYVCMVCMYVCMYVCLYICMNEYMYACVSTYFMNACMHACIFNGTLFSSPCFCRRTANQCTYDLDIDEYM